MRFLLALSPHYLASGTTRTASNHFVNAATRACCSTGSRSGRPRPSGQESDYAAMDFLRYCNTGTCTHVDLFGRLNLDRGLFA